MTSMKICTKVRGRLLSIYGHQRGPHERRCRESRRRRESLLIRAPRRTRPIRHRDVLELLRSRPTREAIHNQYSRCDLHAHARPRKGATVRSANPGNRARLSVLVFGFFASLITVTHVSGDWNLIVIVGCSGGDRRWSRRVSRLKCYATVTYNPLQSEVGVSARRSLCSSSHSFQLIKLVLDSQCCSHAIA